MFKPSTYQAGTSVLPWVLTNTQLDNIATLWSRAVWLAVGMGRAKGVRDELSTLLWLGSPATDPIMAGFS